MIDLFSYKLGMLNKPSGFSGIINLLSYKLGLRNGVNTPKLAPGLYEAGAIYLYKAGKYEEASAMRKASWEELLAEGVVHVENGNVYTNVDPNTWENSSADILIGDLVLPNDGSVTNFSESAFEGCASLTNIIIPDSVTSIGDYAFYECFSLTSVTFNDGVTEIGGSAFSQCYSLTSVTIPDSVTSIGDYAFGDCYTLVEVINKSSLNITIGSENYGSVACYAKEIHKGTTKIVNQNGYLFYTYSGVNYLLGHIGIDAELTLPDSYNGQNYKLYQYVFCGRDNLTSVTIPNGITSISYCAFYSCDNLTSVTIPDSVTSIGEMSFNYCGESIGITFEGTIAQWGAINKASGWIYEPSIAYIQCSDGQVTL